MNASLSHVYDYIAASEGIVGRYWGKYLINMKTIAL